MASTTETTPAGMGKAEIKKHLMIARRATDPIHVAFALDAEGKAIVSMDKRKPPRAIEKALKEQAANSRNHRFGTLTILPDAPKVARIVVNKPASGMARKLILALKGTGIRQIELLLDDGTPFESADSEEDEEEEEDAGWQSDAEPPHRPTIHIAPRHQDAASPADAADDAEPETGDEDEEAADGPAEADTLKAALMGLVQRMMVAIGKDPSQKAGLVELATDAQVSLKRGDLEQAAAAIDLLRQSLEAVGGPHRQPSGEADDTDATPVAGGKAAVQRYRKSRQVWLATRAKVDADIQKLSRIVLSMDHGDAFGDQLEQMFFKAVDPVLSTLDDSLAGILSEAENAADRAELDRLLDQARTTIGLYQQFVADNATIRKLDANPFMPVAIGKTLGASLRVLSASMH